jgi:hypothetical protein
MGHFLAGTPEIIFIFFLILKFVSCYFCTWFPHPAIPLLSRSSPWVSLFNFSGSGLFRLGAKFQRLQGVEQEGNMALSARLFSTPDFFPNVTMVSVVS